MSQPQVRVGVGVVILQSIDPASPIRIILGKRKGSHGAGLWAMPGGHLEFGESFETCAAREVLEETGLKVTCLRFLTTTNDYMESENKHYVTIFMVGFREDEMAEPQVLEPNKCEMWEWSDWENLTQLLPLTHDGGNKTLFLPVVNLMKQRPDFFAPYRSN